MGGPLLLLWVLGPHLGVFLWFPTTLSPHRQLSGPLMTGMCLRGTAHTHTWMLFTLSFKCCSHCTYCALYYASAWILTSVGEEPGMKIKTQRPLRQGHPATHSQSSVPVLTFEYVLLLCQNKFYLLTRLCIWSSNSFLCQLQELGPHLCLFFYFGE